jgi:hypothetical protein
MTVFVNAILCSKYQGAMQEHGKSSDDFIRADCSSSRQSRATRAVPEALDWTSRHDSKVPHSARNLLCADRGYELAHVSHNCFGLCDMPLFAPTLLHQNSGTRTLRNLDQTRLLHYVLYSVLSVEACNVQYRSRVHQAKVRARDVGSEPHFFITACMCSRSLRQLVVPVLVLTKSFHRHRRWNDAVTIGWDGFTGLNRRRTSSVTEHAL